MCRWVSPLHSPRMPAGLTSVTAGRTTPPRWVRQLSTCHPGTYHWRQPPARLMLYTEQKDIAVQKGEPCKFDFSVKNLSAVVVRNLQVGYSIDGGEETVCDFKATMGSNIDKSFTIEHDGFDVVGNHTLKLRVVSINGKDDAYAPNSEQTLALSVKNSVPVQRLVVEEGTGTWCQFCPKGIVGLRKASEAYPNHFIGIAIHRSDNLVTNTYDDLVFEAPKLLLQPQYQVCDRTILRVYGDSCEEAHGENTSHGCRRQCQVH